MTDGHDLIHSEVKRIRLHLCFPSYSCSLYTAYILVLLFYFFQCSHIFTFYAFKTFNLETLRMKRNRFELRKRSAELQRYCFSSYLCQWISLKSFSLCSSIAFCGGSVESYYLLSLGLVPDAIQAFPRFHSEIRLCNILKFKNKNKCCNFI